MQLFTTPGFVATTWQQAFPQLEVVTDSKPLTTSNDIVWLISQSENWQQRLKESINQHNHVIVLSRNPNTEEFKSAFALGARGYLDALSNKQILQTAYQGVKAGGLWIPEEIVNSMIGNIQPKLHASPTTNLSLLSGAELKVAQKVALGESNKEVAEDLNICERTVKSHLTSIYQKLNLRDRMHLMLHMQDTGL